MGGKKLLPAAGIGVQEVAAGGCRGHGHVDVLQGIEGVPHEIRIGFLMHQLHNVRALSQSQNDLDFLIFQRQHIYAVQKISPHTAAVITGMDIGFFSLHWKHSFPNVHSGVHSCL